MLTEGLTDVYESSTCIRQQNNSAVGVALAAVLFNERTDVQLEKILKKL